MAEENTIEWMTEQRDRLKVENDILNPKLDLITSKLENQLLQNADLNRQLGEKVSIIEGLNTTIAGMGTTVDNLNLQLATQASQHTSEAAELSSKVTELSVRLGETQSQLTESETLSSQRRIALTDVMKVVAQILEKVMPLLAE